MAKFSKELIAASSIPLVLSILAEGEDYGYSIIKKVMQASNNQLEWKEGSLYPVLSKLEKKGFISAEVRTENGRKRKYYRINEPGKSKLQMLQEEWKIINTTMDQLWNPRTTT